MEVLIVLEAETFILEPLIITKKTVISDSCTVGIDDKIVKNQFHVGGGDAKFGQFCLIIPLMGLSYGEASFNCTKNIGVSGSLVSVAKLEPLLNCHN